MEPAHDLLARRLPNLRFDGGTTHPSLHGNPVSATLFHRWASFTTDIQNALENLDLTHEVTLTDSGEGEQYIVGNELGLTARFVGNVCIPVAKALSVTPLHGLTFGDIQFISPDPAAIPDVVVFDSPTPHSPDGSRRRVVATGEVKTFWTFRLENFPIGATAEELQGLEVPIGQVVGYMRNSRLKYGFLTTYNTTVFIKRAADFRFELSPPIIHRASSPSVRECFLAFSAIASEDTRYLESSEFDVRRLYFSGNAGIQNSTRPSPHRLVVAPEGPFTYTQVHSNTIHFGQEGTAYASADFIRQISTSRHGKAVLEVSYAGRRALAKYWTMENYERYEHERDFYDALYHRHPQGYPFFASLLAYGEIVCSSITPPGNILIISWSEGAPVNTMWPSLRQNERVHLREQCRQAVVILRRLGIYLQDLGPHNLLYARDTGKATMVDFEYYGQCTERHMQLIDDAPELVAIFGHSGLLDISEG